MKATNVEIEKKVDTFDDDDIDIIVKRVDTWENGIRFAQWNNPAETDKEYLAGWVDILEKLTRPGIAIKLWIITQSPNLTRRYLRFESQQS